MKTIKVPITWLNRLSEIGLRVHQQLENMNFKDKVAVTAQTDVDILIGFISSIDILIENMEQKK